MSARTNLGPLTTAFSYPSSCTVNVIQCSYCLVGWQGQTCSNNPNNAQGVQDNAACWPPRATSTSLSTGVALNGWGIYSPGISCPSGYNTACSATGTSIGGFGFQYPLSSKETGVGCCPPNYSCQYSTGGGGQTCVSVVTSGTFEAIQCSSGVSVSLSDYSVPNVVTVTTTTAVTASNTGTTSVGVSTAVDLFNFATVSLFAPMFQLVHQASDLSSSSSPSASSHSTGSTGTGTGTGAADTGTNTASPGGGSSSHLSGGAIAGIAIGSVVVGLALIGAFVYLLINQRRQQRLLAQYQSASPGNPPPPQIMPDGSYYGAPMSTMSGGAAHSMKSLPLQPSPLYEAPIETPRHELQGTIPGAGDGQHGWQGQPAPNSGGQQGWQ